MGLHIGVVAAGAAGGLFGHILAEDKNTFLNNWAARFKGLDLSYRAWAYPVAGAVGCALLAMTFNPITVIGGAFGGLLSNGFAARHPEKINKFLEENELELPEWAPVAFGVAAGASAAIAARICIAVAQFTLRAAGSAACAHPFVLTGLAVAALAAVYFSNGSPVRDLRSKDIELVDVDTSAVESDDVSADQL